MRRGLHWLRRTAAGGKRTKRRKVTGRAHAADGRHVGQAVGVEAGKQALHILRADAGVALAEHVDAKHQQAAHAGLGQWRADTWAHIRGTCRCGA